MKCYQALLFFFLNFECLQNTIDLLEFMNLSDKVVTITSGHFSVSNMNHATIDVEINLT